jgi:hypothetical protein
MAQGCSAEYAPTFFGTQADHFMPIDFFEANPVCVVAIVARL